jgi:hypothetical protein
MEEEIWELYKQSLSSLLNQCKILLFPCLKKLPKEGVCQYSREMVQRASPSLGMVAIRVGAGKVRM